MSANAYLTVMLGIIALLTIVGVPSLLLKKCPGCGKRNALDAGVCKTCGMEFPGTAP